MAKMSSANTKKLRLTYDQYENLVSDLCRQIVNSSWRPDYVVGISRGGLMAATMISHYFDIPMQPLEVSLRDGGICVSHGAMAEDAYGYDMDAPKNMLIVDDINDSGATFNWIINDWQTGICSVERWDNIWNNNVKFAVIVDNLDSQCKVSMDFVGMEINKSNDNVWIEFPYEVWWK